MLGVVCWKWKPKGVYRSTFGPETVNILKAMVKRHYHKPHRFICVTDDPRGLDPDIKVVPLWNDFSDIDNPYGASNPSCYRRLKMFGPEAHTLFGPRFVSLDLDCVITADMGPLWDRPEDIVLWGDTNPGTHYNGSMMLMTAGARPAVWDDFHPEKSPRMSKARGQFGSDQGWISYRLGPGEAKWSTQDGVFSYRVHLRNRPHRDLPRGARIVIFHGSVDPWSPQAQSLQWVRKNWRYDPSTKEGIEAINLARGVALLTDGRCLPILQLLDEEGNLAETVDEAVSFIAGRGKDIRSDLVSHYRQWTTN